MSISDTITARWADLSARSREWARRTERIPLDKWELFEEGHGYVVTSAASAAKALEIAREGVDADNYGEVSKTTWIDVAVRNIITGEEAFDSVPIDPEEPECSSEDGHDWASPLRLVGGIEENPGVWCHGGGVFTHEACLRCGAQRSTDTWAQRPDTGEQGLTSVSYEAAGYYDLGDLA